MLDHIEVALLGTNSSFLTHYTATMSEREELFRAVVTDRQWKGYLWVFKRFGKWPVTRVNASAVWATMQIIVSIAGALIAILIIK